MQEFNETDSNILVMSPPGKRVPGRLLDFIMI